MTVFTKKILGSVVVGLIGASLMPITYWSFEPSTWSDMSRGVWVVTTMAMVVVGWTIPGERQDDRSL